MKLMKPDKKGVTSNILNNFLYYAKYAQYFGTTRGNSNLMLYLLVSVDFLLSYDIETLSFPRFNERSG